MFMEQFRILFHKEKWNDLQHRIDSTRLPKLFLRENWDLGVDDGREEKRPYKIHVKKGMLS